MLSYAGVALTPPTDPDVRAHLDRWWMEHRLDEWEHPGYFAPDISRLPIDYHPRREPPSPGVLSWPNGASRWAVFHHFATQAQVDAIRAAVGTSPTAKPLVIDTRTTDMYLVGVRPVLQHSADRAADYWLLTLVDVRFYWWQKGDQSAPSAPASWSDLLTGLFTAVGASPTIDSIPSEYGTPDVGRWDVGYRPIPLLIDAACRTVGLRVVRRLDGTVKAVSYDTAQDQDDANWGSVGSELFTGGRATGADVARGLPATVAVVFNGASPAVGTKTLASLALSVAAGVNGVSGAVGQIVADMPSTASSGDRNDYRDQAAADWYSWQFALTDAVFRSAVAWVPTGLEDRVEWVHDPGVQGDGPLIVTRVIRPPWGDANVYGGPADGGGTTTVTPPFAVLTETTGPSSWQGREVNITSGSWSTDGTSGTDNARPFLMDGSTFTPKPTANVLLFADSGGDLGYLPVQAADRVSSVDYPGYVSAGAQTWNGNKTFADYVVVNLDIGGGTALDVRSDYGGSYSLLSAVGGTYPYVNVGGGVPAQMFVYSDAVVRRLYVKPAGIGGLVASAPGQIPSVGSGSLVYPYDPVSYPNTLAFFGASGVAVLMTPSAGILSISTGITTSTGAFNTSVYAYDYTTTEHTSPYGSFTGGTVSDGGSGYYFLNGLYISGSGAPVMVVDGGTTGLTVSGTTTATLGGTLIVGNGGTGTDLSGSGPGVTIQGSTGASLSIFQASGTGETSGFTAGSGTSVKDDSTFTGNVGSTAYRISDIVKALKGAKLLAD